MSPQRIEIEHEFHQVVKNLGGVVIEELLGTSPEFQNADYVFHFEKVVAELKCITEDNAFSDGNLARAQKLVSKWHSAGRYASPTIKLDEWDQMPNELKTNLYHIFTKSIKRRIAKANRQIRETKDNLQLNEYTGLLIIANDGLMSIPPAAFIHAIQLTLQRDFSEIRHFIFLTANIFSSTRESPLPVLFWIIFDMQDGQHIDPIFLDRLGSNWRHHCVKKLGVGAVETEMDDIEGFWQAQHLGKL